MDITTLASDHVAVIYKPNKNEIICFSMYHQLDALLEIHLYFGHCFCYCFLSGEFLQEFTKKTSYNVSDYIDGKKTPQHSSCLKWNFITASPALLEPLKGTECLPFFKSQEISAPSSVDEGFLCPFTSICAAVNDCKWVLLTLMNPEKLPD